MECSFKNADSICGVFESDSRLLPLNACKSDIKSHLVVLGISGKRGWRSDSSITERELILNRAGLFDLDEEYIGTLTICPKH